jgi:hypothetical protein
LAAAVLAAGSIVTSALADPPDPTRLPIGDDRLSDTPKAGYIMECRTDPDAGGAFRDGSWFNGDGTYNLLEKVEVEGEVVHAGWYFHYGVRGGERMFATADIPDYPTGEFPVQPDDPAYQFDRNPNEIREQDFVFGLPAEPVMLDEPGCVPGAIGILLSGVVLFNSLDAPGRDAVAHETQDACQGHPQASGVYHNHSVSNCVIDEFDKGEGHSALLGYIVDGFGIHGRRGEDGIELSSADLDECHGHVHEIEWNGKTKEMFHYHATLDFPYTVGCMRGAYDNDDVMMISGPRVEMQMGKGRPGGRPNLQEAAANLGVSETALVQALGTPPPDLAATAKTLGVSEADLSSALGLP